MSKATKLAITITLAFWLAGCGAGEDEAAPTPESGQVQESPYRKLDRLRQAAHQSFIKEWIEKGELTDGMTLDECRQAADGATGVLVAESVDSKTYKFKGRYVEGGPLFKGPHQQTWLVDVARNGDGKVFLVRYGTDD